MRAKTLILKLPDRAEVTMDRMNNHSGDCSGSSSVDWRVKLRIWDMDPDTSTIRCLIRRKIVHFLSERQEFHVWKHEQIRHFAGLLDDVLFARATSQVHYMNLDTLESRVNDLISSQNNANAANSLASEISSSSNGSVSHSWESHNVDCLSPDASYHNVSTSTISSDGATTSPDFVRTCIASGSTSGSTTSRRYLPSVHPRVAANASVSAAGNVVCHPETIRQTLPTVSQNSTDNGFSRRISSQGYVGCWDHHVSRNVEYSSQLSGSQMYSSKIDDDLLNGTPSFSMNSGQITDEASLSEQCDNHLIRGCDLRSSPKSRNPASSIRSFGNVHQLTVESYLRLKSVSDPLACLETGQVFHCIRQEELQPSCQQSYSMNTHSDRLQPQQKDSYSQPQHVWARNRPSVSQQPQSAIYRSRQLQACSGHNESCSQPDLKQLQRKEIHKQPYLLLENRSPNGYALLKGCTTPNPVPIESQTVNSVAQQFHPAMEGSKSSPSPISKGNTALHGFQKQRREERYSKFHEFRLLYDHALRCTGHEGKCENLQCMEVKLLLDHISHCSGSCSRHNCSNYKKLLTHYQECNANNCRICGPDKTKQETNLQGTVSCNTPESTGSSLCAVNIMEPEQPPSKRIKSDESFVSPMDQNDPSDVSVPVKDLVYSSPEGNTVGGQEPSALLKETQESTDLATGPSSSSSEESPAECCMVDSGDPSVEIAMRRHLESSTGLELMDAQPEKEHAQITFEADTAKLESNCMNTAISDVHVREIKQRKLKKSVSLIDSLSSEKIREHLGSLKLTESESEEKAEENQNMGHATDMNTCSLCGLKDLRFEPSARYCTACLRRINPKGVCYSVNTTNGGDQKVFVCCKCVAKSRDSNTIGNTSILKANLMKTENYAETEDLDEWWVHCDKCGAWQHQICTLFNSIRNEAVQADHTCPNCILQEIENEEHKPLPQGTIPGAKELPTTVLSEHIEKWVFRRLEEERKERAKSLGKAFSEVPAAEGLVVRVVSSVNKKLEVKQVFRDVFQEETYPSEFPYRSKAILLFQNIDGADVCLFGMYVQEYGPRCPDPNKRRVSISYIDSVKYFRPKVRAVTGEALRTFVYHEILIGYLDYCKKRGFLSCYIWACPPGKRDDDYILYCHPKIQKMPKTEKLRKWYQTMIRKAAREGIVAEHTNLYDHFFVNTIEAKAKITAARLPYFDNDYWPGAAEMFLRPGDSTTPGKKESKAVTDRVLRAFKRDASIENPTDIRLMYHLGQNIRNTKEDFILAHLWHVCKHCCYPILFGRQWVCSVCRNFQLCEKCFTLERNRDTEDKHPTGFSEKHTFHEVQIGYIPADNSDEDDTIQSETFDTRLIFLGYCQNNHYQFDTLRRAKHSTMMILYNLHNPFSPALVSACVGCHNDVDTADGWRCLSCTGYDLCDSCHHKGAFPHEHELVRNTTVTDSQQSNLGKQVRSVQELAGAPLLHAAKCGDPRCTYPYCLKLKGLFHHSTKCQTRLNGGCVHCRKIWYILRMHARSCTTQECHAPRCKDLKEHLKKQQSLVDYQQQLDDARRRAGAKERMKERIRRQKKAEATESNEATLIQSKVVQ